MTSPSSSRNVYTFSPSLDAMAPVDTLLPSVPSFAFNSLDEGFELHPGNLYRKSFRSTFDTSGLTTPPPPPSHSKRKRIATRWGPRLSDLTPQRAKRAVPEPTKRFRDGSPVRYKLPAMLEDTRFPSLIPRQAGPLAPEPTKCSRSRSPDLCEEQACSPTSPAYSPFSSSTPSRTGSDIAIPPQRYDERAFTPAYAPTSPACSACPPSTPPKAESDTPIPTQRLLSQSPVRYESSILSPEHIPLSPVFALSPVRYEEPGYSPEYPPFSPISPPSPGRYEGSAYLPDFLDIVPSIEHSDPADCICCESRLVGEMLSSGQASGGTWSIENRDTDRSSHTLFHEEEMTLGREEATYSPPNAKDPDDRATYTPAPRVRTSTAERAGRRDAAEVMAYVAQRCLREDLSDVEDSSDGQGSTCTAKSHSVDKEDVVRAEIAVLNEENMRKPIVESDQRLAMLQTLVENERKVRAKALEEYEGAMGRGYVWRG
ncbi:hypothetical protein BU16DRAFT_568390 [Lophium mytilinum]|uniref:Uncharacterized protein n=1 Tax=Lophium mytilinum TaxID=390894 RepID=A0A6A6Q878_9PEZI|nr:hypothetical protein BU16DRAFT_568390 [Lophium mytilinum]